MSMSCHNSANSSQLTHPSLVSSSCFLQYIYLHVFSIPPPTSPLYRKTSSHLLMPYSSLFPFHSMSAGRRKARGSTDDLSLTRAAAWAWFERGSGSESKPNSEYGVTRTRRAYSGPSRYRIEALLAKEEGDRAVVRKEGSNSESHRPTPSPARTHVSLLDSYDQVHMITGQRDRYCTDSTASNNASKSDFHSNSGSSKLVAWGGHGRHRRRRPNRSLSSSPQSIRRSSSTRKVVENNGSLGFWWWRRRAVICGRREDVVDIAREVAFS